jgi:hypothetical protein
VAETVAELLDQVKVECGFDLSDAQLLRALNQRHRKMVSESGCLTRPSEFSTVAGQSRYPMADGVVQVWDLTVAGAKWERVGREVLQGLTASRGYLASGSGGGVYAEDFDDTGAPLVWLFPTPDVVLPVVAMASVLPDDLAADGTAGTLRIPAEFNVDLVAGTIGDLLARTDQRPEAGVFTQQCDAATQKLQRRIKRRLKGSVGQVRVVGYHL